MMTPKPFPPEPIRNAILSSIPVQTSQFGDVPPEPRFVYVPRAHVRALDPDTMLVQGIRGSGKSLWWAALQSEPHRVVLAKVLGSDIVDKSMRVTPGFGPGTVPSYPKKDRLKRLLESHDPRQIWRAVIVHQVLPESETVKMGSAWNDRVNWTQEHIDEVEEALYRADAELGMQRRKHLVVFDALDQTADNWQDLRRLLRGLLQVLLEFRAYRSIRAKAFVRPDMLTAPEVTSFPDASKILANDVRLSWPRADLYALLWQHLSNADQAGDAFRGACHNGFNLRFDHDGDVWLMSDDLRRKEDLQRDVFHAIAGPYMGEGPKRGFPYTWLPNHLGDTQGQVSPRSFLASIRKAVEDEAILGPYALHHKVIKTGVQEASKIRVHEIGDDFPWVRMVMGPLKGRIVPCEFGELEQAWQDEHVLEQLQNMEQQLPPSRMIRQGYLGICKDLEDLGIFEFMNDSRINMPDVYRIGFGLGRRGGIRPVK